MLDALVDEDRSRKNLDQLDALFRRHHPSKGIERESRDKGSRVSDILLKSLLTLKMCTYMFVGFSKDLIDVHQCVRTSAALVHRCTGAIAVIAVRSSSIRTFIRWLTDDEWIANDRCCRFLSMHASLRLCVRLDRLRRAERVNGLKHS